MIDERERREEKRGMKCNILIFLRFPFVCVSIGIVIERIPSIGVVYNPILNEVIICPIY
jgi:hypothetical protein